jgi:hypothetical protein
MILDVKILAIYHTFEIRRQEIDIIPKCLSSSITDTIKSLWLTSALARGVDITE